MGPYCHVGRRGSGALVRQVGCGGAILALLVTLCVAAGAQEQEQDRGAAALLELRFRPTENAQIAIWLENGAGDFLKTVALTEATALRGIGNRPGASQMNSGFRWPYGRREGVLPTWARKRASARGAQRFRRVIFQNRRSEGNASRSVPDYSVDDYFCLSFDRAHSAADALDAVSCATVFSSDKGRFMTDEDVRNGYAEPYESPETGAGFMAPLSIDSLYPPRRDVTYNGEARVHPDVAEYQDHARRVMPDIDAVTMATPAGDATRKLLMPLSPQWPSGNYRACLEINIEGDHNDAFNQATFATPQSPAEGWDNWATSYGYAYRGQPSLTYCTEFRIGGDASSRSGATQPYGAVTSWDTKHPDFGKLSNLVGFSDDALNAPGIGVDRLRVIEDGYRLAATVRPAAACEANQPPGAVGVVQATKHEDPSHAHEWVDMEFAAAHDDEGVYRYDVRISDAPIQDDQAFTRATPAKAATARAEALSIPTVPPPSGLIHVQVGGLNANKTYYVAVRAVDDCATRGPLMTTQFATPARQFTTVTPCFVATATYGSALAAEIGPLRRIRDRHLLSNDFGRRLVGAYYDVGPTLAQVVENNSAVRDISLHLLSPIVAIARSWLDSE